jgi:hypothetical protein
LMAAKLAGGWAACSAARTAASSVAHLVVSSAESWAVTMVAHLAAPSVECSVGWTVAVTVERRAATLAHQMAELSAEPKVAR